MSTPMKRQMVEKLTGQGTPLPVALKAAELPASSYYYHRVGKRKTRPLDDVLVAAIGVVRQGPSEVYGYRKVTRALQGKGMTVNSKKVLRHLRALGLTQPRKIKGQRWTHPPLVKPSEANIYWEGDFTCVWTGQGNAYLCAIIDAWDRDIVAATSSPSAAALEMRKSNKYSKRSNSI